MLRRRVCRCAADDFAGDAGRVEPVSQVVLCLRPAQGCDLRVDGDTLAQGLTDAQRELSEELIGSGHDHRKATASIQPVRTDDADRLEGSLRKALDLIDEQHGPCSLHFGHPIGDALCRAASSQCGLQVQSGTDQPQHVCRPALGAGDIDDTVYGRAQLGAQVPEQEGFAAAGRAGEHCKSPSADHAVKLLDSVLA